MILTPWRKYLWGGEYCYIFDLGFRAGRVIAELVGLLFLCVSAADRVVNLGKGEIASLSCSTTADEQNGSISTDSRNSMIIPKSEV